MYLPRPWSANLMLIVRYAYTRGPSGLALAQFAKPFLDTVVFGDEFVEPETRTHFNRLYI